MPLFSRLLPSVVSLWYHSLKPHGRRCIRSLHKSRCDLLHLPLLLAPVQIVRVLRQRHLPSPRFSSLSLYQPLPVIASMPMARTTRYWFRMLSKTSSSTRLRFLKAMTSQLPQTSLMVLCYSLQGTLMPLRPCPNLAEVVAVLHLPPDGERRMTRMTVLMPEDASRWLTLCSSQSHVSVVSTVKQNSHIND